MARLFLPPASPYHGSLCRAHPANLATPMHLPRSSSLTCFRSWAIVLAMWLPAGASLGQVRVEVAPLSDIVVPREHRVPAEVLPLNDSLLSAEVNAVVREVAADVGARVTAGDLLVVLEETDFELQLQAAGASLAAARSRLAEAEAKRDRAASLGDSQYVSEDELLTRETAVAVSQADIRNAEAQVAIARRNLEKCRIVAPFNGVVQERRAQLGAYVTVGAPLLRLVQIDRLELAAEIPVGLGEGLAEVAVAEFHSQGARWPVRLSRLSDVVATERRARQARLEFLGAAPAPGRSGQLVWTSAQGQLPARLVSRRDGVLGVFLYRDGRAEFTPVPQAEEGRPVSVDLPIDSQVIVQGQDRLQDGDAVELP
jgi:RND family efflux transporter MFP subunit